MEAGTLIVAEGDPLAHRKHWIAYTLKPAGALHVDEGAERAVARGGRSLLPSGVQAVAGSRQILCKGFPQLRLLGDFGSGIGSAEALPGGHIG